jgi:LPS O-antigen subunit length determinant protein (WzzB/FepE family)
LVTLSIKWTDAEIAADWAMTLVARLNNDMRQRALSEAERNVAYLQAELGATNLATLKESIGSLLEAEMQKLMLAKGNEQFAFRIVDSAQVPKRRSSPKRALIVVSATLLGGFLAVFFVLLRYGVVRRDTPVEAG